MSKLKHFICCNSLNVFEINGEKLTMGPQMGFCGTWDLFSLRTLGLIANFREIRYSD